MVLLSPLLLSSLELSDAKVYELQIRALFETAQQFCEAVRGYGSGGDGSGGYGSGAVLAYVGSSKNLKNLKDGRSCDQQTRMVAAKRQNFLNKQNWGPETTVVHRVVL